MLSFQFSAIPKGFETTSSSSSAYEVLEMDPHYQIEARDPLHHWAPELNKVLEEYKSSCAPEEEFSETKFFAWVKINKPQLPRTQYLNTTELEACKQKIDGSKVLYNSSGQKHNAGMKMFVMNTEGEFFVHKKERPTPEKPGCNHSSFFHGAPVAAVGFMHFNEEGDLIAIDDYSGHYKPGKQQVLNVMHALNAQGFDLSKIDFRHRISPDSIDNIIYNAQTWYEENSSDSKLTTGSYKLAM